MARVSVGEARAAAEKSGQRQYHEEVRKSGRRVVRLHLRPPFANKEPYGRQQFADQVIERSGWEIWPFPVSRGEASDIRAVSRFGQGVRWPASDGGSQGAPGDVKGRSKNPNTAFLLRCQVRKPASEKPRQERQVLLRVGEDEGREEEVAPARRSHEAPAYGSRGGFVFEEERFGLSPLSESSWRGVSRLVTAELT